MGFTEEELEARRNSLGASEVAAVVGVSPYQTPHDVWANKVLGRHFAGTEATEWGEKLEPIVFEHYAQKCLEAGMPAPRRNRETFSGPHLPAWATATPDGFHADGAVIEIKVTGPRTIYQWGPDGTDQIPLHYRCQVQWQLLVMRAPYANVVMGCGTDFRVYRVFMDSKAQALLLKYCAAFWENQVLAQVPPPIDGSESCTELIKAMYRESSRDIVTSGPDLDVLADEYFRIKDAVAASKTAMAGIANNIKDAIGESYGIDGLGWRARWGKTKAGHRMFTLKRTQEE